MTWPLRALVLAMLATLVASQLGSQLPLLVKSPYFHSWVTASKVPTSGGAWPSFWDGHIIGWSAWIKVDNTSYQWTGQTLGTRPNLTASIVTPTRTIFSFKAGPIGFNATYLSPIDPSDLVRQSLPFGYLYMDVWSLDGNSHSVQFYSDMTGEWLSSDLTDLVQWNTTQPGNVVCHRMHLTTMQSMVEEGDIAKDGTLFFAMENRPNMTWETGPADDPSGGLRAQFDAGKPLSNSPDTKFRAIQDAWPVLAFRVDLGNIKQTDSPVVWAVGVVRDPVVQYTTSGSIQSRSSYYWSAYKTGDDIIQDVISNFDDVKSKAIDLDNKILADGGAISSNYNDLVSLSLRLVFGGMDITIPQLSTGGLDTSDVKIFMKDIGATSRVTPVETLYAAFPAILYLNASLAGPLLEPLLEFQNSSSYKNLYATPDLGTSYPRVQGNSSDTTELALENCGDMLIMVLAHALKSGDGSLLGRYYDMLKGWADYLEKNTLHPSGYDDADGQSTTGLSNLALKGIMGLYAMGKISEAAGRSDDASHYGSQAQNYTTQWEGLAISSGHINYIYGDTSSWGLIYNLYAAKLLGSSLIGDDIFSEQSQFYGSKVGAAPKFGFPYNTNDITKAKSHWTMFTAATVDSSVKDSMVGMVWQRATLNDTTAFPTTYDPNKGSPMGGTASPAQGAMFAPLALNLSNKQISGLPSSDPQSKKSTNAGAIAGGVVGGVVGFLILLGLAVFFRRRRQRQPKADGSPTDEMGYAVEPFSPHTMQHDTTTIVPSETEYVVAPASYRSKSNPMNSSFTSPYGASSVGGSISPPSTTVGASSSSSRNPGSVDLRTEMEILRREMEQLRSQRLEDVEPPPLYEDGGAGVGMGEQPSGENRSAGILSPVRKGP